MPNQAPIVLVHGIFGFNSLPIGEQYYFKGIPEALREKGYIVPEPPQLNLAGTIQERANDLKRYLNTPSLKDKSVHLIAHSMGGLDSRYMISNLQMDHRILSLTTIGTPHLGSPIANLVNATTYPHVNPVFSMLGINIRGIPELTTQSCEQFNLDNPDKPSVHYYCIGGQFSPTLLSPLKYLHDIIQSKEGHNDGLVSVQSATWGEHRPGWISSHWDGDHFQLVNWNIETLMVPGLFLQGSRIVQRYIEHAAILHSI
jgi:triacylglycerol lipase